MDYPAHTCSSDTGMSTPSDQQQHLELKQIIGFIFLWKGRAVYNLRNNTFLSLLTIKKQEYS